MVSSTQPADLQIVTFLLGREEYAVDVMAIREIIDQTAVTRVANAPPHVEGMVNLRGAVIPVLSLHRRLGIAPAGSPPYIAVLDYDGRLTGFIIDEISDVMRIQADRIQPPPEATGQPWITGIINTERNLVVVLDLAPLAKEY